jgi:hypothetical protein
MTTNATVGHWPTDIDAAGLQQLREARDRGVAWLTAQVADDGRPAGSDVANSWWRAPWALCVGGAPDVAAAMLGWIEREALTDQGTLRPGNFDAPASTSPVYHLSPIAIAAWMLGRYDTAQQVMAAMTGFTDPATGGVYDKRDFATDPVQDTLKTAQLGISSLITGHHDVSRGVASWLTRTLADQPELPARYYSSRRNDRLVTDFEPAEAFSRVLDFSRPHQAYFQPGIAAAFLSGWAQISGERSHLDTAQAFLRLNQVGGDLQFDDPTTVQVCKFGWGAATTYAAEPTADLRSWVVRMGEWFVRRQRTDGAWAPSAYATPEPGQLDLYWKTAEHVMEFSYVLDALAMHPEPVATGRATHPGAE